MSQNLLKGLAALSLILMSAGVIDAAPINLAPAGTATASSEGFGAVAAYGNDGIRDGAFGAGSVFHTLDPDRSAFYQVDLGADYYLDRVQVFPRTDARQASVENFRLRVLADDGAGNPGAQVFSRDYLPAGAANFTWGTNDVANTRGRFVRLERLDGAPSFLTFAEMEVFGDAAPLTGSNVAAGKPATASPAGFGANIGDANDGDIDGDFYHPEYPVYHSAAAGAGQFYQVDLGAMTDLMYLELFDRGDADTTTQFRVAVLDESETEVFSTVVDSMGPFDYDHRIELTDVAGRYVRVETTADEFLAFSEIRAIAVPEPAAAAALLVAGAPLLLRRRGR